MEYQLSDVEKSICILHAEEDEEILNILGKPLKTLLKQIFFAKEQFSKPPNQPLDEEAIIEGFLYPANKLLSALKIMKENPNLASMKKIENLLQLKRCLKNFHSELIALQNDLIKEDLSEQSSIIETLTALFSPLDSIDDLIEDIGSKSQFLGASTTEALPKSTVDSSQELPAIITSVETIVDEFIEVSTREVESFTTLSITPSQVTSEEESLENIEVKADQVEVNEDLAMGEEQKGLTNFEIPENLATMNTPEDIYTLCSLVLEPLGNLHDSLSLVTNSAELQKFDLVQKNDLKVLSHYVEMLEGSIGNLQELQKCNLENLSTEQKDSTMAALENIVEVVQGLGNLLVPASALESTFETAYTTVTTDEVQTANALQVVVEPLCQLQQCFGLPLIQVAESEKICETSYEDDFVSKMDTSDDSSTNITQLLAPGLAEVCQELSTILGNYSAGQSSVVQELNEFEKCMTQTVVEMTNLGEHGIENVEDLVEKVVDLKEPLLNLHTALQNEQNFVDEGLVFEVISGPIQK